MHASATNVAQTFAPSVPRAEQNTAPMQSSANLARLLRNTNRREEARAMLTEIYN